MSSAESLTRPYRVRAHFDDCHDLRAALGELGIRLGEHHVVVAPEEQVLEIEVADPEVATGAIEVLEAHDCTVEVFDFEAHRIC
jgi:hypothetical protein